MSKNKTEEATMEVVSEDADLTDEPVAEVDLPKVGSAEYDWSKHYDTEDLFVHTFPSGKVVALRKFQTILSDTFLYKIRKLPTDLDFRIAAIDEAACETAQAVLESIPTTPGEDPLKDMFTAWAADGTSRGEGDEGLTPGE